MKFSQRIGLTPSSKKMQIDSIDKELRNGLKNAFIIYAFRPVGASYQSWKDHFNNRFWLDYFKLIIDTFKLSDLQQRIDHIFEKGNWFEVYDLLEFTGEVLSFLPGLFDPYKVYCNQMLEREYSAYRFVDQTIAKITSETEIKEIEEVISNSNQFTVLKGANIHLKDALKKLSDKKSPDYRNSIKESISAVEFLAKVISDKPGSTLGGALDNMKTNIKIHQSLKEGFKKLYGYTSDSGGIRHALTEETDCEFEDAKYMLVSCSAFINYLLIKANKAGIKLK